MRRHVPRRRVTAALAGLVLVVAGAVVFSGSAAAGPTTSFKPGSIGGLDCNGFSTIQQSVKPSGICTDLRGLPGTNSDDGRFYDNGHYIGHDEPDLTFLSNRPGSGNDVTWTETLPRDPKTAPTTAHPGRDVTHWFELSVAPWFSMALCNPQSYPENPCTPKSDSNAPSDTSLGAGSSFLEVQFYPPGEAPFFDNISCDNKHWCASLHINDLECIPGHGCNSQCTEPTNFAWIQQNGVPTGPPSPQEMTIASNTPNHETLLMNPGDALRVHIFDAPVPGGGGHALEVRIDDLTTHQHGFMQASAKNGYAATSPTDCSGTPFNYEPEYNTSVRANQVPWAALQTNISTQFEIGHWIPCTSLEQFSTDLGLDGITAGDPFYLECIGPYEVPNDTSNNPESLGGGFAGDGFCYPKGDRHTALNQYGVHSDPNTMTGCLNIFDGGDIDFDGTSYWADWPTTTNATRTTPGSFVQSAPLSKGHGYSQSFFQTDVALSESTCGDDISGCTVPPPGPGNFYPYWSTQGHGDDCQILFGNVTKGPGVKSYGGSAQYGTDGRAIYGYDEFTGPVTKAVC